MKSIVLPSTAKTVRVSELDISARRARRCWISVLLVVSILLAVSGSFGLALAGASLLHVAGGTGALSVIGVAMLAITFCLLVIAAHCLDRIDDANRRIRVAACKRRIFGDASADVSRPGSLK